MSQKEKERERAETHVEGFKVFADLSDELFAALVALREPGVWCVGLGEGEESERGTGEGEEAANVLERALAIKERRWRGGEKTFSTRPRSCI